MGDESPQPSIDQTAKLLASRRRRYALYAVQAAPSEVVDLDDVIDYVVKQFDEGERDVSPNELRQELEIEFHHVHLPKLEVANVIDYDWRSRTVRYRDHRLVDRFLSVCREMERPPS